MARIWHVLGGSSMGGGTYVVRRLCQHLVSAGHQVTVVASDGPSAALFRSLGCTVVDDIPLCREIRPAADSRGVVRLARRLRLDGCDLLHSHTSKGGVVGRVAGRLAGVRRIVHHVHGFAFDPIYTPAGRRLLYAGIEHLAASFCDAMIFVNRADLDLARKAGIVSRSHEVAVVPNGVDWTDPAPAVEPEERLNGGLLRIGFVGRLAPQKGVDVLIDAVQRLAGLEETVEVWVVGDGPSRAALERRARCRCPDGAIRFLGHRADVAATLRALDIVALPSRWEGHSIALLEAMAAGKPVVTTRIKGNLETVEDGVNSLLVAPDDAAALAEALKRLMRDATLRSRLGKAARSTVERRFPAARMIEGVLEVYRRLSLPVS